MAHWSEKYVGTPYQPGVFDCGTLVERVQQEVFGRNVVAPSDRDYTSVPQGFTAKFEAMTRQIDRIKSDYAIRTTDPVDGDAILLQARGYFQHLGLLCIINGERWVLHATDLHKQVVLHRLTEMEIRGMRVEGYYRWK